jgi:hypothetical protein
MKTMLPVMLATNTRPRTRKLKASTSPVIKVRANSKGGSGPCRPSMSGTTVARASCSAVITGAFFFEAGSGTVWQRAAVDRGPIPRT